MTACGVKLEKVFFSMFVCFFSQFTEQEARIQNEVQNPRLSEWQVKNFEKNEIKQILLCESFDHVKSS